MGMHFYKEKYTPIKRVIQFVSQEHINIKLQYRQDKKLNN